MEVEHMCEDKGYVGKAKGKLQDKKGDVKNKLNE